MTGHVVDALWQGAGCPEPNWQGKAKTPRAVPQSRKGICAITGVTGPVWDSQHVISDLFTGWDTVPFRGRDPAGLAFGPAAAWVIRHQPAMRYVYVMRDGVLTQADPPVLYAALVALPDEPGSVISVPSSGQKHLWPSCAYGMVRTDALTLRWLPADAERLGTLAALRRFGFGESALGESAPRWAVLAKLGREDQAFVLLRWSELDPWRRVPAYLDVATRATRIPKEGKA